eukprot:1160581-Pelagomonas_calceolata.AAC.12
MAVIFLRRPPRPWTCPAGWLRSDRVPVPPIMVPTRTQTVPATPGCTAAVVLALQLPARRERQTPSAWEGRLVSAKCASRSGPGPTISPSAAAMLPSEVHSQEARAE